MPCEDWDPDDDAQGAVARLAVCAPGLLVETTSTGATVRWAAGGELSLEVRPDLGCRIRRGPDTVVLDLDGLGTGATPRARGVAAAVEAHTA